jgi:broad specificity phosphatase PhoE
MDIYILRHGEKTQADPVGLSETGNRRALEYSTYLQKYNFDEIYAMRQHKQSKSNRSFLTLLPFADTTGIPINLDFTKKEINKFSDHLKTLTGKKVLVCWEHKEAKKIIQELTGHKVQWRSDDYSTLYNINNGHLKESKTFDYINDTLEHSVVSFKKFKKVQEIKSKKVKAKA